MLGNTEGVLERILSELKVLSASPPTPTLPQNGGGRKKRRRASNLPPPPGWGRAGEGVRPSKSPVRLAVTRPPTPTLPHKGGGSKRNSQSTRGAVPDGCAQDPHLPRLRLLPASLGPPLSGEHSRGQPRGGSHLRAPDLGRGHRRHAPHLCLGGDRGQAPRLAAPRQVGRHRRRGPGGVQQAPQAGGAQGRRLEDRHQPRLPPARQRVGPARLGHRGGRPRPDPRCRQELARPGPGGALVALHHDLRRHRPCGARAQQGLAQGGTLRPHRESGLRRPPRAPAGV